MHSHVATIDRKVAMLRVVEALRLHAGRRRLPQKLDQVTIVPIPVDPMYGKAFEYTLKGETAEAFGGCSPGQAVAGIDLSDHVAEVVRSAPSG